MYAHFHSPLLLFINISLTSAFYVYVTSSDPQDRLSNFENPKNRNMMQDALQLRFSLLGGMFDTIQRNTTVTTDWAILLVQLVTYGVVDLNNNP